MPHRTLLAICLLTSVVLALSSCKHASSAREAKLADSSAAESSPRARTPAASPAAADQPARAPAAAAAPAPVTPPKGVDVKDLDKAELKVLLAILEDQFDPCGKPRSFRQALEAGDCALASRLARFVVHKLQQGYGKRKIVKLLLREIERVNTIVEIDVRGAPALGPADAKVKVVEFSDFQCPFCRRAAKPVRRLQKHYGFRLVFKNFPLKASHPFAEGAAMAARAAHWQGKFWAMHDLLFAKAPELEWGQVKGYAKSLGLDLKRFVRDARSDAARKAVARDYEDGTDANVDGTPTFFVNGRRAETLQQLQDAVREQFSLAGVRVLPPVLEPGVGDPGSPADAAAEQAAKSSGAAAEGK